jgi:hypothetical protein
MSFKMHSFTIGIIMAALAAPGFAQDVMNGTATIAGPTPATGGLNLAELLSDPKYAPFIQIVTTEAPMCLSDKAILDGSFDLGQCPELETLLEAVQAADAGNVEAPEITCSIGCVNLFNSLGEACRNSLINGVRTSENKYISEFGNAFFDSCNALGAAPSQVPIASAPEVDISALPPAEVPTEVPVEVPAQVPVEEPTPIPVETPAQSPPNPPTPALPPQSSGRVRYVVALPTLALGVMAAVVA